MIPNIVIDNFFVDPDKVKDYGLSLEYKENDSNYPGTRALFDNDNLRQGIEEKILSVLFDFKQEKIEWDTNLAFQKVSADYKGGWIHQDNQSIITCVIYLTPTAQKSEGTTIYRPKTLPLKINDDIRTQSFKNGYSSEEEEKQRIAYNNQFESVLTVDNIYNRLFMFAGNQWHGVPEYKSDRLTLIYFVHGLNCKSLPIMRKDEYQI